MRRCVIKICYSENETVTYNGALQAAHTELNMFKRLPRHDHIIHYEHAFSDRIPSNANTPPGWDADVSVVGQHALFIVMELCHLSLQDVISYRRVHSVPFRPEEILLVARHISSALILLNKELVAHRDIKPDNILIRLPANGSITREHALDNINQPGISVALTDFGSLYDFKANKCTSMSMVFPVGMPRGGARNTQAPEIAANPNVPPEPVELDYTKADVWSLGVILATMIDYERAVTGADKQLVATFTHPARPPVSTAAMLCYNIVINTVTAPADRWSCYDVYRHTSHLQGCHS